ncbi:MAG: hypothetical protein ABR591_00990 [Candidatus Velthaea sp.]
MPAGTAAAAEKVPAPAATRRPFTAAGLYSPRARRAAQIYLRLRLLEMRETDLDRARAVIERRLGIEALVDEPAPPLRNASGRNMR